MSLRQRVQRLSDRIDALSLRERGLVMLAIIAVVTVLWYELFMAPLETRREVLATSVAETQQRIQSLNDAITRMANDGGNQELVARRERLQSEIERLEAELRERTGNLVAPEEMAQVLEKMLQRTPGLELVEIRNLPAEPVLPGQTGASVYRHGIAITVEGRYATILDYVTALENLSWRFYWDSLRLETEDYPVNRVTIVVYTLSLEEGLLGV